MKQVTQRILCTIFAIAMVLAFGTPAFAADNERDVEINHTYFDQDGNQENLDITEWVSTASPTRLSDLVYPVLGQSGGDMEYNVVNFHLEAHYVDNRPSDYYDWSGAEVATVSFQFLDDSVILVYEAVVEYDTPRPYTAPRTSSGSSSSGGSGGSSNYLGYIGVFGLPQGSVETGSTVKLTTNPGNTSVRYDEAALSLERLENGEYRVTVLRDGVHSITFSARGYSNRTVEITGRTTASLTAQDNETHDPSTGGYPDGGVSATDNPNTGASTFIGLGWVGLLLSGAGIGGMKYAVRRRD